MLPHDGSSIVSARASSAPASAHEPWDPETAAVVLCGGLGQRLAPLTDWRPKPLLPLGPESMLSAILGRLKAAGCRLVHVGAYHLAEQVIDECAVRNDREFRVVVGLGSSLRGPVGDAAELIEALPREVASVVVVNGDTATNLDYARLLRKHHSSGRALTLCAGQTDDGSRFGVLECSPAGELVGMTEKPRGAKHSLVSMGTWITDRSLITDFAAYSRQQNSTDFAADLWPWMRDTGVEVGVETLAANEYWEDLGTVQTLYARNLTFRPLGRDGWVSEHGRVVGPGAVVPRSVVMRGRCYVEAGAVVAAGVQLEDAVVLRGEVVRRDVIAGVSDGRSYPDTDDRLSCGGERASGCGSVARVPGLPDAGFPAQEV